jgi:hypothetical protein
MSICPMPAIWPNATERGISEATSAPRTLPREEIRPAWRAAVLAYRANMRVTQHNEPAWHAAYAAFREVLPEMPEEQAKMETTHAIAYAAANHTKWFWGGVYG